MSYKRRKVITSNFEQDEKSTRGDYVCSAEGQLSAYKWRDNRSETMFYKCQDPLKMG